MERSQALALLQKYNKEPFHIMHALTVEGVIRWYAQELGYGDDVDFWGLVGLLHDVDFEQYPDEHCKKAPELLAEIGADDKFVHAVVCHGYGDELTGLIWAAAKMRPSKSTKDMEVKSLKKKFKDKRFAAGCSREVIQNGAELLGWDLAELFEKTILAMRSCEDGVRNECRELTGVDE